MIHWLYLFTSSAFLFLCLAGNQWASTSRGVPIIVPLTRPSQIFILYVCISYIGGSILFSQELVMNQRYIQIAGNWTYGPYFLWSSIMLGTILLTSYRFRNRSNQSKYFIFSRMRAKLFSVIAIFFLFIYSATNIYFFFIFSLVCLLFLFATDRKLSVFNYIFLFAYLLLLFPIAADSKRLLIFPLIIIVLIRANKGNISLKTTVGLIAAGLVLIIPLSVMRGYGNFEITNYQSILMASIQFVQSDVFLMAFGNNTEVNYFYFHGINSIEMFLSEGIIVYGETIAKSFFLGLSRVGLDNGLRSGIEIYTSRFAPDFRAIGGSYPINLVSEMVLNFWIFALILTPPFFVFLDKVYLRLQRLSSKQFGLTASFFFLYSTLLLGRGSSFNIFMLNNVYGVLSLIVVYLLSRQWNVVRLKSSSGTQFEKASPNLSIGQSKNIETTPSAHKYCENK